MYEGFNLDYMAEKIGVSSQTVDSILQKLYKLPFTRLVRKFKIRFLRYTLIDEPDLTLKEYAFYAGHDTVVLLLDDIKLETNFEYDEFIINTKEMQMKNSEF